MDTKNRQFRPGRRAEASYAKTSRRLLRGQASGKVNVFLAAGAARADGFHELATIFQAVSLKERVDIETMPRYPVPRGHQLVRWLHVTGRDAERVPRDETNLAVRAVEAVAEAYYQRFPQLEYLPALHMYVHKGIPTAGGMAGGSADAAAALWLMDRLLGSFFGAGLGTAQLMRIAAQLGSDVPFVLRGGTALGTGRGERLERITAHGRFHWVFALAKKGLSTPAVFRELDRLRADAGSPRPAMDPGAVIHALSTGDPELLAPALHNDLEVAAFSLRPELADLKARASRLGALGAILCGSGPTMAFLCADELAAARVQEGLRGVAECAGVCAATAPAGGAELARGGLD
ncbi:4-(cytidine 5'-diphospho)-2-C-methyl-D-erythritol kinase [Corynebacterium atypicum]|uniref:4-(cytidine 5'-diphospho)-2-C-methyl-D-erythritol kinase n=1 Tax=Corynebacterium atypicum TaxID=191610 RepID=UPI000A028135|nr:4-(cytidine 5'-diphospho)-2-C-methyl-D-erythritol kinase [Corynebacterium atypicum]